MTVFSFLRPRPARAGGRHASCFAALTCLACLLLSGGPAKCQEDAPLPSFSFEHLQEQAQLLAATPYENPEGQVPQALLTLPADQWQRIRFKQEETLWRSDGLSFGVRFFAPGGMYNRLVRINVVEDGQSAELPFRPEMFDTTDSSPEVEQVLASTGFAGFSLTFPLTTEHSEDEFAVFLGASFFQAVGRQAAYGVQARGLALNTALADGEEFPHFREFWLFKPQPGDQSLTVLALLDSPSLTGAYRFVMQPGTSTIMDVDCQLFLRLNLQKTPQVGMAPLGGMYLSAETRGAFPGDYRPEVHSADGLLSATLDRGWQWRPLNNGERLAIHSFEASRLLGFGLLQRDDNYDHYQDISARFERNASLWVEPKGDWGSGRIELIEIPTKSDMHRNVTAFWVSDQPNDDDTDNANGNGTASVSGSPENGMQKNLGFSYRMYWMTPGVTPHSLGRVTATRLALSPHDGTKHFVLDFEGETLKELPADTGLTSIVELPQGVELLDKQLVKNPVTGGWRLSFRLRMPPHDGMVQSILAAREGVNSVRLRAVLKRGENIPEPLTETWVFDDVL